METRQERHEIINRLNALLEREYNSLVQYLLECDPWIPEEHRDRVVGLLRQIAEESRNHARTIVELIHSLQGSPAFGNYDHEVINLSYLSIQYSLQRAIDWKSRLIDLYDQMIRDFSNWDEVADRLRELRLQVDSQRERLSTVLESLGSLSPAEGTPEDPAPPEE